MSLVFGGRNATDWVTYMQYNVCTTRGRRAPARPAFVAQALLPVLL